MSNCEHEHTFIIRRNDGNFVECTEVCKICGTVVRKWIEQRKRMWPGGPLAD